MKGQISIFLALVFLVMFSIFGMTISTGMFIHDKINLQNGEAKYVLEEMDNLNNSKRLEVKDCANAFEIGDRLGIEVIK